MTDCCTGGSQWTGYLWGADFIEGDKYGCVDEEAEGEILVEGQGAGCQQDCLWHKRYHPQPSPSRSCHVQQVKVGWKVVASVLSCDMVQVGLLQEVLAIAVHTFSTPGYLNTDLLDSMDY